MNTSMNTVQEITEAIKFANYIIKISHDTLELNNFNNFIIEGGITGNINIFKEYIDTIDKLRKFTNRYKIAFDRIKVINVPKELACDLIKVLNVMYPRTLYGIEDILKFITDNINNPAKLTRKIK